MGDNLGKSTKRQRPAASPVNEGIEDDLDVVEKEDKEEEGDDDVDAGFSRLSAKEKKKRASDKKKRASAEKKLAADGKKKLAADGKTASTGSTKNAGSKKSIVAALVTTAAGATGSRAASKKSKLTTTITPPHSFINIAIAAKPDDGGDDDSGDGGGGGGGSVLLRDEMDRRQIEDPQMTLLIHHHYNVLKIEHGNSQRAYEHSTTQYEYLSRMRLGSNTDDLSIPPEQQHVDQLNTLCQSSLDIQSMCYRSLQDSFQRLGEFLRDHRDVLGSDEGDLRGGEDVIVVI